MGTVLAQAESVTITYTSNDKAVKTLLLGLAGFSNGAQEASLQIKSALPLRGFESDFARFCDNHITRRFTIREANKISTFEGRFLSVGSSSSVDTPNALDVQFSGKMISRLSA